MMSFWGKLMIRTIISTRLAAIMHYASMTMLNEKPWKVQKHRSKRDCCFTWLIRKMIKKILCSIIKNLIRAQKYIMNNEGSTNTRSHPLSSRPLWIGHRDLQKIAIRKPQIRSDQRLHCTLLLQNVVLWCFIVNSIRLWNIRSLKHFYCKSKGLQQLSSLFWKECRRRS